MRAMAAMMIVACAASLAGCASPYDGVRRGPWMHHSINEAYRLAERDGAQPVELSAGIAWVKRADVVAAAIADYSPAMGTPELMERAQRLKELAATVGVTCRQIVREYNEGGKNWAIFGESITWSSVAAGLAAAIDWIGKQNGGDDNDKPKADPAPADTQGGDKEIDAKINGNGNRLNVSYTYVPGGPKMPNLGADINGDQNQLNIDVKPAE